MKRKHLILNLLIFALLVLVTVIEASAQSSNQLSRRCPGVSPSPARAIVNVESDGDIVVTSCSGRTITIGSTVITGGLVSSTAVIADNAIVRGDGGSRGVQTSPVTISDSADITTTGTARTSVLTLNGNLGVSGSISSDSLSTGSGLALRHDDGVNFSDSDGFPIFGTIKATGLDLSVGTFNPFKGTDLASAAAITPTSNVFHLTGTTNVTSIVSTNFRAGATIHIIFDGALTFTDGGNLRLAGNFVTTADDTITLVFDGTNWFETARSVN